MDYVNIQPIVPNNLLYCTSFYSKCWMCLEQNTLIGYLPFSFLYADPSIVGQAHSFGPWTAGERRQWAGRWDGGTDNRVKAVLTLSIGMGLVFSLSPADRSSGCAPSLFMASNQAETAGGKIGA
jgi:hypothetical protein